MGLKPGWPTWVAIGWSLVVVGGCYAAVSCFDYPDIKTTGDFVVLVRNVAIMGAAAIALPVSLYTLWMKDAGFRADLRRTIREELERERQEREEQREREQQQQERVLQRQREENQREREREQRENQERLKRQVEEHLELEKQIVSFVIRRPSCTIPEIQSALPDVEREDLESMILNLHDRGLIDVSSRRVTAFEGNTVQFGPISITHKGREWLHDPAPD